MTERQLNRPVDLYREMKLAFGAAYPAAWRLIHDGQVQIDGHVVLEQWAKDHWRVRQLQGRMLSIPHMGLSARLFQKSRR